MRCTILVCCLAIFCTACIKAECPNRKSGMIFRYGRRLCARVYEHEGCDGKRRRIFDGDHQEHLTDHLDDKISSIVVEYGCVLQVHEDSRFGGGKNRYLEGVKPHLKKSGWWGLGKNWNDVISSYKCGCGKKVPPNYDQESKKPENK